MGLRNGSSATVGVMDLLEVWRAYEVDNSVELKITGRRQDYHGRLQLVWTMEAYDTNPLNPEAKLLACANVGCLEKRLHTMEAVLLQLLYAVDFQFAEKEFARKALEG